MLARLDIAEKNFQAARERLKPVQSPDAYMLLAGIEETNHNQQAAIALYTKVIAQDSRNVVALNNLAFSLSGNQGRLDEALKYAQSAKELAPTNSYTLDTLGWIYYRKGLFQLAVKELESALAAETRPAIQYHLGLTYQKTGNTSKGNQLVTMALAAQPDLIKTLP
jgi:tetratricopeptide (TPR) repeat protein